MAHNHDHQPANFNSAFITGITLNIAFVVIEAGYGVYSSSLALIADAGHNLSDVLSLALAWGASLLATKSATEKRTYGLRKVTIMASLISAIILLVALGSITWEAIGRLAHPQPAVPKIIIFVAAIGVVINTATALLFVSGHKHDINIRAAYLHMAADAGVSLGVVVAGLLMMFSGWQWLDPVISLIIVAIILISTWSLFQDSINRAIDAVPENIDIRRIQSYFSSMDKVLEYHDLHVWPLSTTEVALTIHLVVIDDTLNNTFLTDIQQELHDQFGIEHSTIQIEKHNSQNICLLNRKKCI